MEPATANINAKARRNSDWFPSFHSSMPSEPLALDLVRTSCVAASARRRARSGRARTRHCLVVRYQRARHGQLQARAAGGLRAEDGVQHSGRRAGEPAAHKEPLDGRKGRGLVSAACGPRQRRAPARQRTSEMMKWHMEKRMAPTQFAWSRAIMRESVLSWAPLSLRLAVTASSALAVSPAKMHSSMWASWRGGRERERASQRQRGRRGAQAPLCAHRAERPGHP